MGVRIRGKHRHNSTLKNTFKSITKNTYKSFFNSNAYGEMVQSLGFASPLSAGIKLGNLAAPLRLTGHPIIIAIHLHTWAVAQKEGRFFAGAHLRAIGAAIAAIAGGGLGCDARPRGGVAAGERGDEAFEGEYRRRLFDNGVAEYRAIGADIGDHRAGGRLEIEVPERKAQCRYDDQFFHRCIPLPADGRLPDCVQHTLQSPH